MASSGPNLVGTGADDATVGSTIWQNPSRITAEDASSAGTMIAGPSGTFHYCKGTNCGFAIPAGATIDGIVVEVKVGGAAGFYRWNDNAVRIVKGGTIGATDKSSGVLWPGALTWRSFGSSSDLWGETWTAADINAATFGAAISAKWTRLAGKASNTPLIDAMRITVYYTAGNPRLGDMNFMEI